MRRRGEAGFALLAVLLLAALLLISLSAAVPRVLTQGRREKETELIFRGEQYRRAIGFFYKQFGRYPNSMEELLETNDRAFLRREWPDPMTLEGEWRLIRAAPNGEFIGSVHRGRKDEESEEEQFEGDIEDLPIAGVASRSREYAIRVYDGYQYYNEWEFIFDPLTEAIEGLPQPGPPSEPDESESR
ncbi:MAG: hypothetical protein V3U28_10725 [Candidatus Acidoferrales bacterium]